jgi:hypothetical protein
MIELIGESIGTLLREEREQIERDFRAKLLELRCDLLERQTATFEALRKVAGGAGVSEMPKWPRAASVN